MGIRNGCPAFDVAAVCSGFLYGITIAGQFIQNGVYDHVLVIGADTFSKVRTGITATACSSATAAAPWYLRGPSGEWAVLQHSLRRRRGNGSFHNLPEDAYFSMNGKAVYEKATAALPECIRQILCVNRLGLEDVSMIIPHQASAHVLKRAAEILNVPYARIQTNLELYANTAGATVPLLLDQRITADSSTRTICSCSRPSAPVGPGARPYTAGSVTCSNL